jgi:hypothetical protein
LKMNMLNKALGMIMDEFYRENGNDAKIKEGDEISAVFNDGVIIIGLQNKQLQVKVIAGEPYRFDFSLDLVKKD